MKNVLRNRLVKLAPISTGLLGLLGVETPRLPPTLNGESIRKRDVSRTAVETVRPGGKRR
jgi:hypothetical protein